MQQVMREGQVTVDWQLTGPDGAAAMGAHRAAPPVAPRPDGGAEVVGYVLDVDAEYRAAAAAEAARAREAAALAAGRAELERLHAGLPAMVFLRAVAPDGSSRRLYRGGDIAAVTGWPAAAILQAGGSRRPAWAGDPVRSRTPCGRRCGPGPGCRTGRCAGRTGRCTGCGPGSTGCRRRRTAAARSSAMCWMSRPSTAPPPSSAPPRRARPRRCGPRRRSSSGCMPGCRPSSSTATSRLTVPPACSTAAATWRR